MGMRLMYGKLRSERWKAVRSGTKSGRAWKERERRLGVSEGMYCV